MPTRLHRSRRALALKSDYAHAHTSYANTLYALGRHDEAVQHFDQAIALDPEQRRSKIQQEPLLSGIGPVRRGLGALRAPLGGAQKQSTALYQQPRWDGGKTGTLLAVGRAGPRRPNPASRHGSGACRPCRQASWCKWSRDWSTCSHARFRPCDIVGLTTRCMRIPSTRRSRSAAWVAISGPDWDAFPRRERGYLVADAARTSAAARTAEAG